MLRTLKKSRMTLKRSKRRKKNRITRKMTKQDQTMRIPHHKKLIKIQSQTNLVMQNRKNQKKKKMKTVPKDLRLRRKKLNQSKPASKKMWSMSLISKPKSKIQTNSMQKDTRRIALPKKCNRKRKSLFTRTRAMYQIRKITPKPNNQKDCLIRKPQALINQRSILMRIQN